MIAIVFFATTVFCLIKWCKWRVATSAILYYMAKNDFKLPNDEELEDCTKVAALKMFKVQD